MKEFKLVNQKDPDWEMVPTLPYDRNFVVKLVSIKAN